MIRSKGLITAVFGVFAITIYYLAVSNLKQMALIDFKLYDLSAVTTGDFTCEITISQEQWDWYKEHIDECVEPEETYTCPSMWEMERPMVTLCQHLETELCRKVNMLPGVTGDDTDLKIAHLTFTYDNEKVLSLLMARGDFITGGEFAKLKEINDQIDKLFDEEYGTLFRPVGAFITWETQEGYERSMFNFPENMKEHMELNPEFEDVVPDEEHNFLGQELRLRRATEPTDIIWQNRHTTHKMIVKRSICVGICIFFVLLGALLLFDYLSSVTAINQERYPPTTDCAAINQMFMENGTLDTTEYTSNYWIFAQMDSYYTIKTQGTGIFQCYCSETAKMIDFLNPSQFGICIPMVEDEGGGYFLTEIITVLITVVNIIITAICVFLIQKIQFHTVTKETAAIMSLIFIGTFFNTAILLLLTAANFEYSILSFIPLRGAYTDLDVDWYINMGDALVWTLLINALNPYISITISFVTVTQARGADQGYRNYCCCKHSKDTKQKTIQGYVNLYSGPPHQMFTMYGVVLCTIWTVLMYGMALPILFPIGALTFINVYLCERLGIAYWYTKPPEYDADLNDLAIKYMFWAPILFFAFGYWTIGNTQMFNNQVYPIWYPNQPIPTDHNGIPWEDNGPSMAFFLMFSIYCIALCCGPCIDWCLSKCNLNQQESEEEVDEALGSFFECIGQLKRKDWLATEVSNANRLGIKTMGQGVFEAMRTVVGKNKKLKNGPNYEILTNDTYTTQFQYVAICQRDDPREISTSEYVSLCLLYPFRRQMDEDVKGIHATPRASQMLYLNDGLKPKMARKSQREKTAALFLHKDENGEGPATLPTTINEEANEDDQGMSAVATAERQERIIYSTNSTLLAPPFSQGSAHPVNDGYASRFLGFTRFRRNIHQKAVRDVQEKQNQE